MEKRTDRRTIRRTYCSYQQQPLCVVSEGIKQEEIGHVYGMINGIEGFLKGTSLTLKKHFPGKAGISYLHPRRLPGFLPL